VRGATPWRRSRTSPARPQRPADWKQRSEHVVRRCRSRHARRRSGR
jgi:hypothetical protein